MTLVKKYLFTESNPGSEITSKISDYLIKFNNFCFELDKENMIKGTILLADEGINGTISGREKNIRDFLIFIKNDSCFNNLFSKLDYKESWASKNPFYRIKVRLKKEIVALGVDGVSPTKKVGNYVKPEDWNDLISDPNTIIIDTRNNYEVDIGTFKDAISPNT